MSLGGGLLLGSGIQGWNRANELDERGVEVPAVVLDVHISHSDSGDTSTLRVRFKPRGDAPTRFTTDVTYDGNFPKEHPRYDVDGVRVQYDPKNPEHARVAGEAGDWREKTIVGGLLLAGVMGTCAWLLVSRAMRRNRSSP